MRSFVVWSVVIFAIQVTATGQAADQPPKELTADLGGGVKMEMVLIPAGEFMMGQKGGVWTEPVHKVSIAKPFYLGKYEVTQEQWQAVMGNNPSHFKGPKNPVDSVGWEDCQGFVTKLNEKFRSGGEKFALPTEAQWEYGCRAKTTSRWNFGDDEAKLGDYAWWAGNAADTTHPVGQKKPNAWGLYDMHGNVAEWCAGGAEGLNRNSQDDSPLRPKSGDPVLRGGSRYYGPALSSCACRHYMIMMGLRHADAGFRVVRTVAP
jgi:formylglycine-generating enzyme required for sulfatase activity